MVQLLRRIHRELGVTILHITHNRNEARLLAQLQLVLNDGQVREISRTEGTPEANAC